MTESKMIWKKWVDGWVCGRRKRLAPKVLLAWRPPSSIGAERRTPAALDPSPYNQANVHTSAPSRWAQEPP